MSLAKKRKLSDLTAQDTNTLLSALAIFESTLDENDEELPSELIYSLEKLRAVLDSEARAVHACILVGFFQHSTSFSEVDPFTLVAAHILVRPLFLSLSMKKEIEALGKTNAATSFSSFDSTINLIKLVRNHVFIMVGQYLY